MLPTKKERDIAHYIQGDIFLERKPFEYIGAQAGLSETEVIDVIKRLREKGVIRRFGAILRHQKAGFTENAMIVWEVPLERCDAVGHILATYQEITHCYERTPPFEGKYNIFSMIHCAEGDLKKFVEKVSEAIGIKDYKILRSEEEFKKSSMEYF